MAYLLDTNVIFELRKPKPHGAVVASTQEIPEQALFVAAITIGGIQAGSDLHGQMRELPRTGDIVMHWS